MRVVQLNRFGGPEMLEFLETATPVPRPGEILVQVRAAGVNYFEVLLREDRYATTPDLPLAMGVEVAGIVEAVGKDVPADIVGTRVAVPLFGIGGGGGYADNVIANADDVCPLPPSLSFEDAAALQVQGLTALHLVRHGPPRAKKVLITAAAGGVGSLLVQLSRSNGAELVIAAASTHEKRQLVLSLGADVAIDYTRSDWGQKVLEVTGGGVDIAYDLVGGRTTKECLNSLAPGGELMFSALGRVDLKPSELEAMFGLNQAIRGFALLPLVTREGLQKDLAWLFDQAAQAKLRVVQGGQFPLASVADAHRALESRASVGKIVLTP